MVEQEIERKIADFRALGIPEHTRRDAVVHLADRTVSTVIGARRAGKSFRVLQLGAELIRSRVIDSPRAICGLDFDNPVLAGMSAAELLTIQKVFLKVSPEYGLKSPLLFIFDEIHKIQGWENYVVDLSRNPHWKVVVTGSSSRLLRDNLATELRGKALSSVIYPLSFAEFLAFRKCAPDTASTAGQAQTARLFEDYLNWGGYPALANLAPYSREALLREYFDTMILRDIIQRYNVSKPQQCVHLCRFMLSNISRPSTLQSAYDYLKASSYATSRDAVREYLQWAEDAWLLFLVPIFAQSHKQQERNYRKVYAIDWALAMRNSPVWDGGVSRALENLVFLHLKCRYARVCYYLTRATHQEVDFLATDASGKPVLAVQVCQTLAAPETLRREVQPLAATAKYFGIKESVMVTLNEERDLASDGQTIHVVPAWKWLLADETS